VLFNHGLAAVAAFPGRTGISVAAWASTAEGAMMVLSVSGLGALLRADGRFVI
jgi:hypothetical protein